MWLLMYLHHELQEEWGEGATKSSLSPTYGGAESQSLFIVWRFLGGSGKKQVPEVPEGSKIMGDIF